MIRLDSFTKKVKEIGFSHYLVDMHQIQGGNQTPKGCLRVLRGYSDGASVSGLGFSLRKHLWCICGAFGNRWQTKFLATHGFCPEGALSSHNKVNPKPRRAGLQLMPYLKAVRTLPEEKVAWMHWIKMQDGKTTTWTFTCSNLAICLPYGWAWDFAGCTWFISALSAQPLLLPAQCFMWMMSFAIQGIFFYAKSKYQCHNISGKRWCG